MTDSEKLQAILDYAKRSHDSALLERHMVEVFYYENKDASYTYDMVRHAHQMVSERSTFFHKVKQIIDSPEEYLKEKAFIEDCVKRLDETRKEVLND